MNTHEILIRGVNAVLPTRIEYETDLLIRDGRIQAIGKNLSSDGNEIDGKGAFAFPGFIDVHVHGGFGHDFMDGTVESFETAIEGHLHRGTTMLLPTAMASTKEEYFRFLDAYKAFRATSPLAPLAPGLHFEGPFFAGGDSKSRGAQKADAIRPVDLDEVREILDYADGSILRWDAAPELEGAKELAAFLTKKGVLCAVAHSDAIEEEATAGFEAGFSHVTHFYNAVTAYKKRDQLVTAGVVEATYLNDEVTVELICDGKHLPRGCMLLALKMKKGGVLGITDAMRLAGTDLPSGKLGSLERGSEVISEDGVAKLPDRSFFAGSLCTMDRALRVVCRDYGIDPVTAASMLSAAPARHIGLFDTVGSLEVGKMADIVLASPDFEVMSVIKNGRMVSA